MNTADWIEIRQFCHIHEIAFNFIDQVFELVAECGRESRGLFQGWIQAFVLEAE